MPPKLRIFFSSYHLISIISTDAVLKILGSVVSLLEVHFSEGFVVGVTGVLVFGELCLSVGVVEPFHEEPQHAEKTQEELGDLLI